jgi:trans-aconitate 2-methyltransferase
MTAWDPDQYERFKAERAAPFHDLLALVAPVPGGHAVDLGCGTGALTLDLHRHLRAASTLGIDSDGAMLARAAELDAPAGLSFEPGDIGLWPQSFEEPYDVVFSNAALQWVPDHPTILGQWARGLGPGGQLAVQVPSNADHAAHVIAREVALEPAFFEAMEGDPPPDPVLSVLAPEAYAALLDELGFVEQHVRLQVYGHRLPSTAAVVEWVKGTNLTRFRRVLPDDLYEAFLARYEARLVGELGERSPYFYPFKRVLLWGRRPG